MKAAAYSGCLPAGKQGQIPRMQLCSPGVGSPGAGSDLLVGRAGSLGG